MSKDLRREFAQQLGLIGLGQFLKDGVDALALGVADGAESVAGHGTRDGAREIRDDEAHGATAEATDEAPELARRTGLRSLGHALLAQHLLEHGRELVVAIPGVGRGSGAFVGPLLAAKPKSGPWEGGEE